MPDGSLPEGAVIPPPSPPSTEGRPATPPATHPTPPIEIGDTPSDPLRTDEEREAEDETTDELSTRPETVAVVETEKVKIQENEVIQVANNTVKRVAAEAASTLSTDETERRMQLEAAPDKAAFIGAQFITSVVKNGSSRNFVTPKEADGINLAEGKPIETQATIPSTGEVKDVKLLRLHSYDGANFVCYAQIGETSAKQLVLVKSADMIRGQFTNTKDALLSSNMLSPAQQKTLEQYIAFLETGDSAFPQPGTPESKALDNTTNEAARDSVMFRVDDAITFVKTLNLPEETQKQLESTLQGHILLSYDGLMAAMDKTPYGPAGIEGSITALQAKIDTLRKDPAQAENLAMAESQLAMLTRCKELYETKKLQEVFTSIQEGTVDQETAKALIENFRAGKLLEGLQKIPGLEKKPGETQVDWEKRLKDAGAGLGILAFLLLAMGTMAIQEFSSMSNGRH